MKSCGDFESFRRNKFAIGAIKSYLGEIKSQLSDYIK